MPAPTATSSPDRPVVSEQLDFPLLAELTAQAQAKELNHDRQQHLDALRACWPEWDGPAVAAGLAGRCEIARCGEFYMAPATIIQVLDGGNRFRVAIRYEEDAPQHCRESNGTEIEIDLEEIWPPTNLLWRDCRHPLTTDH